MILQERFAVEMGMTSRQDAIVPAPLAGRRPTRAPGREGGLGYALWGIAGFLLGAFFWHVVGFWDFIANVVHRRDHPPTMIERLLSSPSAHGGAESVGELAQRELEAYRAAQTCTTLMRDRTTGRTSAQPCMVVIRNVPQEQDLAVSLPLAQTGARLDRTALGPSSPTATPSDALDGPGRAR